MEKFTTLIATMVAIPTENIDTDQIIPKQFLKRIERSGYEKFLFYDWRYHEDGSDDDAFELLTGTNTLSLRVTTDDDAVAFL